MMNRYKTLAIFFIIGFTFQIKAQEIGYNIGMSKQGIDPGHFQPLYGMSIGARFSKHFAIETNMLYSQRTIGTVPQADYLSFVLMPKFGYFTERIGVYLAPSLLLNPCLYHSNTENHTYASAYAALGFQLGLGKKIIVDAKMGYDMGLTGAYFINNTWQKYKGPMLVLGMKLNLGPVSKKG